MSKFIIPALFIAVGIAILVWAALRLAKCKKNDNKEAAIYCALVATLFAPLTILYGITWNMSPHKNQTAEAAVTRQVPAPWDEPSEAELFQLGNETYIVGTLQEIADCIKASNEYSKLKGVFPLNEYEALEKWRRLAEKPMSEAIKEATLKAHGPEATLYYAVPYPNDASTTEEGK